MKIKTLTLTLESDRPISEHGDKLRGFFATRFNEYTLLHQHMGDQFVYKYPLIQYKVLDGSAKVLGINEGVDVLKEIFDKYESVKLGESEYKVYERQLSVREQEVGFSDKFHKYAFLSPWFALNEENFPKYLKANPDERQDMLRRILRNNILSMSAGVGNPVEKDKEIKVDVKLRETRSRFKGKEMFSFRGEFVVNFIIPDLLGLGKSVSRGFGTVKSLSCP
jgi:hypothetical protein